MQTRRVRSSSSRPPTEIAARTPEGDPVGHQDRAAIGVEVITLDVETAGRVAVPTNSPPPEPAIGYARRMAARALPRRTPEPEQSVEAGLSRGNTAVPTGHDRILAVQRSAGNGAVCALLMRAPGATAAPRAEAAGIAELRRLLQAGDEHAAIAHMGRMTPNDAAIALGMGDLRSLAVKAFDDAQMAHAMYALKGGTLLQKLNWMSVEDSSWELVKPLLVDPSLPPQQKTELYAHNYMRTFFSSICGDERMEEAVVLLGGSLEQQLNWMFVEGTSVEAVRRRIRAHDPAKRPAIYRREYMRAFFVDLLGDAGMAEMVDLIGGPLNDRLRWMAAEDTNFKAVAARIKAAADADLRVDAETRAALREDLSAKEFKRIEDMLDRGVLDFEEFDSVRKESHWEKKDYTDPASKWYLETFGVESKFELEFRRTALIVRVRIQFTGSVKPTPAHLKIWRDGIDNVWKDKFHLENAAGKKLPIVFDARFGAPNPHHKIELLPPVLDKASGKLVKGRADAGHWYAGPNANSVAPEDTSNGLTAAHEFGHLIGLADEYQLRKADYERMVGPAPAAVEPAGGFTSTSIMGDKTGGPTAKHMETFVVWLNRHLRGGEDPYVVKVGPP